MEFHHFHGIFNVIFGCGTWEYQQFHQARHPEHVGPTRRREAIAVPQPLSQEVGEPLTIGWFAKVS